MSKFEERLEHTEKLVKGLSEQTSGNITIINSNCQMLANRLEAIEKKVQELETKTASDLSQTVVAESTTSEEQDCLWVARDKRTDTLYVYEVEPVEQYCETFAEDDEEEKSFRIDFDLFPQVTFENSPQKLVLESSIISKTETVEKGYEPTIDDFFYNRDEENSEKPNKQDAFTELRAKLEDLENRYDKEVSAWSFDEILNEIREVIE